MACFFHPLNYFLYVYFRLADCQKDRETERQRDRETERQRNRETERQRDRKREREGDYGSFKKCDILFPHF
jgi:hypothetical protein